MNLIAEAEDTMLRINCEDTGTDSLAPTADWREMKSPDHFVQFYENDNSVVESVSGYIASGLSTGDTCIAITMRPHREAIENNLRERHIDLVSASASGRYVMLDASETLSRFMQEGMPDPSRFEQTVGQVIARAAENGAGVRAFGEMVATLWSEGNHNAAIRLEDLWNNLAKKHAFSLFCAYSMESFGGDALTGPFRTICSQHSHVIPTESYTAMNDPGERLREISRLQQKAQALEAEIACRKEAEAALCRQKEEVLALNARLKRAMMEMQHRVKNNLQVIAAMIEMQEFEYNAECAVPIKEFVRLKSHVNTLAVVHDLLTTNSDETEEERPVSIKEVLEKLLPMLEKTAWKQAVSFKIADASIPSKQCVALSLVANELITNSLKHGKSRAELTLTVQGRQVRMEVGDDGPGFPMGFNVFSSARTGLELVESLVRTDLLGQTYFENSIEGGARVYVVFELPDNILSRVA